MNSTKATATQNSGSLIMSIAGSYRFSASATAASTALPAGAVPISR